MLKSKNINLKNIKISFRISSKVLADKAFLIFLGFLSIALILGTVIFYKYSNLIKESSSTPKESSQFNEKAYNNILTVWQVKEEKLRAIDLKKYQDPFNLIPQKLTK
jgi:hypothetical protein